jgi:LuxR family maltose regulon positive regulatory protein
MPILATKFHIPPVPARDVPRRRLLERLNEGLAAEHTLTLVSAPAGFGKTTLLCEWISGCSRPAAWLSLDEEDGDPVRFLAYLVAALNARYPELGRGALGALQSPQPPPIESIVTAWINEVAAFPEKTVLILDDYHAVDSKPVDDALGFLVEHLPPQMHLVIATREDPDLPLARLRARDQLTEVRAADLRFTAEETAGFLNREMGLNLSPEDIAALETRTEGWIAGLQLAAISMRGSGDTAGFIRSFTGSHRFVLDYLVEEVLQRQTERVQTFLLHTSILDRMCGPLCDAVLEESPPSGQATLEYLDRANLFLIPLDSERLWYRYHHLFSDFLRQRLGQKTASASEKEGGIVRGLHIRASQWFEADGLVPEAFRHAAAAEDVDRAERLMESRGMGLHLRAPATAALDWLKSLPKTVLDARPLLWVRQATISLMMGQTTDVEEKLLAAEAALEQAPLADGRTRNLIGQIAAARATLALTRYDVNAMLAQGRRALEYLPPDNLPFLFTAHWTTAFACLLQGDRAAAGRASEEALSISRRSGDRFSAILAGTGLAQVYEMENRLPAADETYRQVLQWIGEYPLPNAAEVYLGLARISYEWNDLDSADRYGQKSLHYALQYSKTVDRFLLCEMQLARVKLARGDADGAYAALVQTDRSARERGFTLRIPEIAAAQAVVMLRKGETAAAAELAGAAGLPVCRARVHLAKGEAAEARALLEPLLAQMEAKGWHDERLRTMVLLAVVHWSGGAAENAVALLGDALELAEPGGFIRLFADEGAPMARLLAEALARGVHPEYVRRLLSSFPAAESLPAAEPTRAPADRGMPEPLSAREREVLQLIAQGLTNQDIADRLCLSLHTVKAHARNINAKLGAGNRTQAVARGRALGILSPR